MSSFVRIILFFQRVYWRIFKPTVRGARCVITDGSRVLLVKNRYGTSPWAVPGGSARRGETPEQAARREIMEELGIMPVEFLHLGDTATTRFRAPYHLSSFSAVVPSDIAFKPRAVEIIEAAWFPFAQIPQVSAVSSLALEAYLRRSRRA